MCEKCISSHSTPCTSTETQAPLSLSRCSAAKTESAANAGSSANTVSAANTANTGSAANPEEVQLMQRKCS